MAKPGWCCVSHLRKQALFASKFALSHGAYDCKLVIYRKGCRGGVKVDMM